MNDSERTILFNQYEILKFLNPSGTKDYEMYQEIISCGFSRDYPIFMGTMAEKELDASIQDEVIDILRMFRVLNDKKSNGWTPTHPGNSIFQGFDGNNDPHYRYAIHILRERKEFDESSKNINSHSSSSLDKYRRMLEEWSEFGKAYDLTDEQAEKIILA